MKTLLLTVTVALLSFVSIDDSYVAEIKEFQQKLNEEFKDPNTSPLTPKEIKKFKGHEFFEIDKKYRVEAKFIRTADAKPFEMKTTTSRAPVYEKYGEAVFELNGEERRLSIYQSHRLRQTEEYKNYLFLPFTDLTNGESSYGGGRYIDMHIPDSETIIIDFNKAYNPYCAYSETRSCPIPPKENFLNLKVEAGVKLTSKKH